jgi:regulatory protein
MLLITAIKLQKRKNRVNVFLDGKFFTGLDTETYLKSGLKENREITIKEAQKLKNSGRFNLVWGKALKFVSLRPRSEREIKSWLKRKKISEPFSKKVWGKLKSLDLIDDLKFASWWVEQRMEFKPKPKMVIQKELKEKGIDRETIEKAFSETKIDEVKIARDYLEKYQYRFRGFEKRTARQKRIRFLASKGFSWEIVKEALSVDDGEERE